MIVGGLAVLFAPWHLDGWPDVKVSASSVRQVP